MPATLATPEPTLPWQCVRLWDLAGAAAPEQAILFVATADNGLGHGTRGLQWQRQFTLLTVQFGIRRYGAKIFSAAADRPIVSSDGSAY